ncbi:MAG: nitroreductase family protein [Candidatus Thorarchaeota archaeon]|nr:nitroreductase family protein [Candidatus Thorarchaeota archaeon]
MTSKLKTQKESVDDFRQDTRVAQGMQAMKLIRSRRSIRHFTGAKIPDHHIELILEAARHAPSPENMLMMRFIVIRDDQEIKEFISDIAQENAQRVFGSTPFELTSGRNWYIEEEFRAAVYSRLRDGEIFRYPEKSDTVIIVCVSDAWNDAVKLYPNDLFGSVTAGMAVLHMWLVASAMGYGCGYEALPFSDPRHATLILDKLGIPSIWTPLTAFCIGVPAKDRQLGPSRPPLEGLMYDERWGKPYRRLAFRNKE